MMKRRDLLKKLLAGTGAAVVATVPTPAGAIVGQVSTPDGVILTRASSVPDGDWTHQRVDGRAKAIEVTLERTIRKSVRKNGGFRKGLNVEDADHARVLLAMLGRTEVAWDTSIRVPGFEEEELRKPYGL